MVTRFLFFNLLFFSTLHLSAQWNTITSTITEDLNDVHFSDSLQGIAVGASGGVYLTLDGGYHWQQVQKTEDASLRLCYRLNADTLFVGGDLLYRSIDRGESWIKFDDKYFPRDIQFSSATNGMLTDAAKTWVTADGGLTWTETLDQTNTLIIEGIFLTNDEKPVVIGNIDGGIGYSALGYKQSDDGNWYILDVFSFPNANAYTNAWFMDATTCYMFANHTERWLPGPVNEFWKLTNFRLVPDPFTEELTWYFDSEIVNSTMPEYINSSYFIDALNGYAAGDSGRIYKTGDGGINWVIDYNGSQPLKSMVFTNNHRAVAVGKTGTIVVMGTDYSGIGNQVQNRASLLAVQPNPANRFTQIMACHPMDEIKVYNNLGQCVKRLNAYGQNTIQITVDDLPTGIYVVRAWNSGSVLQSGLLHVVK